MVGISANGVKASQTERKKSSIGRQNYLLVGVARIHRRKLPPQTPGAGLCECIYTGELFRAFIREIFLSASNETGHLSLFLFFLNSSKAPRS